MSIHLPGSRVLLRTALTMNTGYGADGCALAAELENIGAEVHLDPHCIGVPLPPKVALMLARPRPDRFELVIQHADPASLYAHPELARRSGAHITWTMWEFSGMRGEEFEPDLAEKIAANDGIIGYTQETTDILRGYASPDTCLTTIQGGYDADLWKPREDDPARDWDSPTTRFGMLGSLNLRKNVWAALEAFNGLKETFGPEFDAELILKANLPGLPPQLNEYPGVTLIYEPWSHRQIRDFYMGLHCLLAPSWGEGKNLPALEAQTLGIPVIATPCSGHMAWANPDFVYLAKSTLVERDPNGRPGQLHHQVDVEGLADKMWEVHTNRQEARRRGEIASRVIPQMCDWSRVVERLGMWLDYDMVPKPR